MGGIPDVMFVIDANKEELAIKEANVLGIPVIAILDSNVSPDGIAFPVPANDDAARAIRLYCEAIATASSKGNAGAAVAAAKIFGAMVEPPVEAAVVEVAAEEAPVPKPAKKLHRKRNKNSVIPAGPKRGIHGLTWRFKPRLQAMDPR
jgi:small subunit ribosomal protein S2